MDEDEVESPERAESLTIKVLDDIIDRLINYEKYPGYTVSENKVAGSPNENLPFILKEKEIRQLISSAEEVFKE